MEQITEISLKRITFSGLRNQKEPVTYAFGDMTFVSGHNGTGKTTVAHAITFALYGVNFYGEQKIEHLRNQDCNLCEVQLTFLDQNGTEHLLQRRRTGDKTELFLDSYTIRQEDINRFLCDKETFLCLFNPVYLTECAGSKGRDLILKNLKTVTSKQVLAAMSEAFHKPLEGLQITDPAEMLSDYRAAIRRSEEQQRILEAQLQTLGATACTNETECRKLSEKAEECAASVAILKDKQFGELDLDDFCLRRQLLTDRLKQAPTDSSAVKIAALEERLRTTRERVYASKFSEPLAKLSAELSVLSDKYHALKERISGLAVGSACPTCLMRVTDENISQIKDNLTAELNEIIKQAQGLTATRNEMLETDRKSKATFEQYRKNDIDSLSAELDTLHRTQTDEVTPDIIQKEIEEIDQLLWQGLLSDEEFSDLQAEERQLAEYEAQIKKLREYSIEQETTELTGQIKAFESERKTYADIVASLQEYTGIRTELATAALQMPHTKIALFETVKTTGELKSIFRFDYNGYPYISLSLSEKMLAGLEITALLRKITGLSVPVCIDNTESVAAFDPASLPTQTIMLRMIKGKPLTVQAINNTPEQHALPKAG